MNNLANLTQKLKLKPVVEDEEDIEVAIIPEQPILKKDDKTVKPVINATKVIAEKDDGTAALDFFKRLENRQLTKVSKKVEEEKEVESKAPIVEEEPKKTKIKKQKTKGIMAEDVEKVELVIEGGPQMVEKGKEKEPVEMVDAPTKSVKRYSKKIITGVINLGPASLIQIGDTTIGKRLPPPPVFDII